jgi:hypothetical protein
VEELVAMVHDNVVVETNNVESVVECSKFGQHLPADSFSLNDSISIFSG